MENSKKVGVREIARLAKVSIGTVDRALHGRKEVSEKTRQKVLKLAALHGYEPDPAARALAVRRAGIRIGICIPKEIRYFYDQVRDGLLDEARRFAHTGVDVLYEPIPKLGAGEKQRMKKLLDEGVRAVVVTPANPADLAPLIDEAENRRNVRVVCVASDDSLSARSTSISVEPRMNGRLAGELMAKLLPAGSSVAIVTGLLVTEDHAEKVRGFSEAFPRDCPGGGITGVIEGHENDKETYTKTLDLLRNHPGLKGIYVSTAICLPVCRALVETGRAGKMRLITTDLFTDVVPYFENGTITAAIYQHPHIQGQTAMRLLVDHFVNGTPLPKVRHLNPGIVMRSNLHMFREISGQAEEALAAR